ncbi:MAG: hypothetical protein ABI835_19135 [Chloroflexota bacterium]
MQGYHRIGLFALLTVIVTGAAVGHLLGLSASEGIYITAFVTALIGWFVGRWSCRREERR